ALPSGPSAPAVAGEDPGGPGEGLVAGPARGSLTSTGIGEPLRLTTVTTATTSSPTATTAAMTSRDRSNAGNENRARHHDDVHHEDVSDKRASPKISEHHEEVRGGSAGEEVPGRECTPGKAA
ncbi:MAG: hypothetical protein M3404_09265, partial [Actinomycetota bacterium]|nr:hypothetical protein [Actinomycetota bacterium]